MKNRIIFLMIAWVLGTMAHAQNWESDVIKAIESDEIDVLQLRLEGYPINEPLKISNLTLLEMAVRLQSVRSVKTLLESGANPNISSFSRKPLMVAVQKPNIRIIKLLIHYGADVNARDSLGNSVLMMAAIHPATVVLKLLIRNGAALNVRNKSGFNARDFAIRANNHANVNYLRNVFEKRLPNYFDGPYVRILGKRRVKVNYFIHDSLKQHTRSYSRIFKGSDLEIKFNGFMGDSNIYQLHSSYPVSSAHLSGIHKMMVLGDVHGQLDTLKIFLEQNGVINAQHHWNFGNGTLVFMGDIFDRGEQVTEALWFIYQLEQEAEMNQGHVVLLLGNHEIMEMQNDLRYLSDKYFYMFSNLRLPYSKFYNQKTILGRWLRSKNTMVTIDSFLFVHGGLHPNILDYHLSIDSVNHLIQLYLNNLHKNNGIHGPAISFLLSYNGPLWFRGMVEFSNEPTLSDLEVTKILNYFGMKYIFVGHTYHPHIMSYNQGRVISTDVPYYLPDGNPMEGLLVENQNFFILNSKGEKKALNLYAR